MPSNRLLVHRAALALSVALLASATPELAGGPAARIRAPGGSSGRKGDRRRDPAGRIRRGRDARRVPRATRTSRDDRLFGAALTADDVGAGWSEFDPPGISGDDVVRIGGNPERGHSTEMAAGSADRVRELGGRESR